MMNLMRELDTEGIANTFNVRPEIENAPSRRNIGGYDLRDSNHSSSMEEIGETLQKENDAAKESYFNELRKISNFDQGPKKWQQEICETISTDTITKSMKIGEDLGVIGLLVYTRLSLYL